MKVTGKSGRKWVSLEDAITGPDLIGTAPIANEEVTPEEVEQSFLKVNGKAVSVAAASCRQADALGQSGIEQGWNSQ